MKNEKLHKEKLSQARQLTLNNIGVVYCTSNLVAQDREFEKLADYEVIRVAHSVQAALQQKGYSVKLIDLDLLRISDLKEYDWVINLIETIYGFPLAEHEIAEQMERLNIHFTGSGSYALRRCLDKAVTKSELMKYGILTPAFNVVYPGEPVWTNCNYPVIVKPVHEDGSIGISNASVAWNIAELTERIEKIHQMYCQAALIEEFIEGRDIIASILGNGKEAMVLPLSEVTYPDQSGSKFLTFETKWISESLDYRSSMTVCPCLLAPQVEKTIRQIALKSCQIMDCRDYVRVDFRLKDDVPYVLEINPNPSIDRQDAGFALSGAAAGIEYPDLVNRILLASVKNYCETTQTFIAGSLPNGEPKNGRRDLLIAKAQHS